MSLRWDWSQGVDRDDLGWIEDGNGRPRVAPITEAVIFATMAVGISRITEKRASQFTERVTAWEAVNGTHLQVPIDGGWAPRPLTIADVRDHIGLHTNATSLTRTEFGQRLATLESKV